MIYQVCQPPSRFACGSYILHGTTCRSVCFVNILNLHLNTDASCYKVATRECKMKKVDYPSEADWRNYYIAVLIIEFYAR